MLRPGMRVKWQYRHSLGRNYTQRIKRGVYHGKIRHTAKYKGNKQLALVTFDGNLTGSKVPYNELQPDIDEPAIIPATMPATMRATMPALKEEKTTPKVQAIDPATFSGISNITRGGLM